MKRYISSSSPSLAQSGIIRGDEALPAFRDHRHIDLSRTYTFVLKGDQRHPSAYNPETQEFLFLCTGRNKQTPPEQKKKKITPWQTPCYTTTQTPSRAGKIKNHYQRKSLSHTHTSSTSTTIDLSQITYIPYIVVVKLVANQQTLSKNGVGEGHPASATPTENPSKTPKLPF